MSFLPELIRRLADRHVGVGLTSCWWWSRLTILTRLSLSHFNADGSEVSQCGNGALFCPLCTAERADQQARYPRQHRQWPDGAQRHRRRTGAREHGRAELEPSAVPFRANKAEKTYIMRAAEQTVLCGVVSMGNPHCVIQVDDVQTAAVETLGPVLESHERFPERANIGFMQVVKREHIRLRVYERGAGETQACGSGACAAVAVGISQGLLAEEVRVELPCGRLDIARKGAGHPLYMTGPATHVYDGFIHL